ncbi:MAG: pitrilysin family protein [Eggerthellaceae bacterium]|nr:pitrilysin family protein [Eggerthellaceae bacterium]
MAFERTVLDNGITVVSEHMPWVRSITLGFWFRVGSRHETADQAGLTHFMEHMMFKGTDSRSAIEISEAFDALGAESNAFTAKEYTCYHARFVDHRLDDALELLADMVLHSTFRDEDILTEREVVLEEIASSEDEPDDHVFEMFLDELLPTHPLGRPVLGTVERVASYGRDDCISFHRSFYHAGNLVVSAAGNVDHASLVWKVQEALAGIRAGKPLERIPLIESNRHEFAAQKRDIEQAYLVYGFPWYRADARERFAGSVLTSILGGSASSRLFQEVREKRGLAYSIMAGASVYSDTGQFYVYCATRPDNLAQAAEIIRHEMARIADEPPSAEEVSRNCEVITSQLLLGLESTSERMIRLGRRETMGFAQVEVPELIERYASVTPDEVQDVARKYLTVFPTATVVSPFAEGMARQLVLGR